MRPSVLIFTSASFPDILRAHFRLDVHFHEHFLLLSKTRALPTTPIFTPENQMLLPFLQATYLIKKDHYVDLRS
jgi:hypothetical protein